MCGHILYVHNFLNGTILFTLFSFFFQSTQFYCLIIIEYLHNLCFCVVFCRINIYSRNIWLLECRVGCHTYILSIVMDWNFTSDICVDFSFELVTDHGEGESRTLSTAELSDGESTGRKKRRWHSSCGRLPSCRLTW